MRKLKLIEDNLIWKLDSYKQLHDVMYPEGTEYVASYAEARSGSQYPYTVFFGLQYQLIRHLEGIVITKEMIDEAEPYLIEHFKFNGKVWNRAKWDYIVEKHGGKLPVQIMAAPEGMIIPKENILFWIINTDPECFWLPNALETLLQWVWYPTAVCTRSHFLVSAARKYFAETVDNDTQWLAEYMIHDFGQRAVSCQEQGGIGGMAHIVNSKGTDTDLAIAYAVNYYGADKNDLCYSVPASEHSIATAMGPDKQYEVTQRMCQVFPTGVLSVVSDSYGIEDAVKEYCNGKTREFIIAREGKFVVRPDSKRWAGDSPEAQILWIVKQLSNAFGFTLNTKGYAVLNSKVGIIYGDGLSQEEILRCFQALKDEGYAASNCVYGQGGGLLQKLNRDTIDFAIKCFAQVRNGQTFEISKSPMGGTKKSKKGFHKLVLEDGVPTTVPTYDPRQDILRTVFLDGKLYRETTFDEVRKLARNNPYLINNKDLYRPIHNNHQLKKAGMD
jgi:nicotinamide phosphoribosyltransferase